MASMSVAGTWLTGLVPEGVTARSPVGISLQGLSANARRLDDRMKTLATFGANDDGGIDRVEVAAKLRRSLRLQIQRVDGCQAALQEQDD